MKIAGEYIPPALTTFVCAYPSFMFHDDEGVKRSARAVVSMIADRRGGELSIFKIVKERIRNPQELHYEILPKINEEIKILPKEGLEVWKIITRLCKEHIIKLADDRLNYWLRVP